MAVAVLAGALVLVTMYYAWQNRRMVGKMRAARVAQVLPKLGLTFGAEGGVPRIVGVGCGPALESDVTMSSRVARPCGGRIRSSLR